MSEETAGRRVVLAPDLLIAALFVAKARAVLNEWRDGRIRPVLNRELLFVYLRLLREIGLNEKLLQDWTAWFTNPEKVFFVDGQNHAARPVRELCIELASGREGCEVIGFNGFAGAPSGVKWVNVGASSKPSAVQ